MSSGALASAYWAFGRGTGVVALVLFTISLVLGIVARSGRGVRGLGRFGISDLHRTAALTGTGLVVAHVGSLFLDPYSQLEVVDFVLPFLASYRPLWLGLGTVALDLIGVVTVVSLLRHRVGPKVFKVVHRATYLLWPTAMFHALGSGTDSGAGWFRTLVVVCIGAVVTAVGWRFAPTYAGRGRPRHQRRTV
jgi:sulfoxide reductase heme-binding subunit YedZ